jgi:hypothetical protein
MNMNNFLFGRRFLRVILLICFAFLVFFSAVTAQEKKTGKQIIVPSLGFKFGIFYPEDVNSYIDTDVGLKGIEPAFGTYLIFNYELTGGLNFIWKNVDLTAKLAYGFAPKFIHGQGVSYYFSRASPGISANYFFYMTEKVRFFTGLGLNYDFMSFEGIKTESPGSELRAGVSIQTEKFDMQPHASFLYAKGKASDVEGYTDFSLSFISFQIGIILSFHPRITFD